MTAEENMQFMQSLDDAWNAQDWDAFDARHAPDTIVHWPGQPSPTRGREDHRAEAMAFFATFPDNHVANRPYQVLIGRGEWTCSVARFTGTMTGPMRGPGGEIPPTGRAFAVDFCTVAHWADGMIVEENLFYDLVGLMRQIGLND
ncbi:ester cyclase [Streptomyces sp. NPDC003691]